MKLLNDDKPLAVCACIDVVGVSVSEMYAGVDDGMDFTNCTNSSCSFSLLVYVFFVVL